MSAEEFIPDNTYQVHHVDKAPRYFDDPVDQNGAHVYIGKDDIESWWVNGEPHRDKGAALILKYKQGDEEQWYQHGRLHRDVDEPAIIRNDGTLEWWKNGEQHRDPYIGPAIIYDDPDKDDQYWRNGRRLPPRKDYVKANYGGNIKPAKRY